MLISEIATRVAGPLQMRQETIALAESCTGGLLAASLTALPGASAYFAGGVVAYANAVKEGVLAVPHQMLIESGAVSEPVAVAMAEGVRALLQTDWAISTTGIAGPGGGSLDKPVGTVWIAVAGRSGAFAHQFKFAGSRDVIQRAAVQSALEMLLARLEAASTAL